MKDPGTAFKDNQGLERVFLQDAEIEVLISLTKSLCHSGAGGGSEYGRQWIEEESSLGFWHPIEKELLGRPGRGKKGNFSSRRLRGFIYWLLNFPFSDHKAPLITISFF